MAAATPLHARKRRWPHFVIFAICVSLLSELTFIVLARNSTIPYRLDFIKHQQGGTTYLRYWDGRAEFFFPRQLPTWFALVFWSVPPLAVGWTAIGSYLTWSRLRTWRQHKHYFRFTTCTILLATVLAGVCLTVVTLLDPENPPLARMLQAAVMLWMIGCLFVLRQWRRPCTGRDNGDPAATDMRNSKCSATESHAARDVQQQWPKSRSS